MAHQVLLVPGYGYEGRTFDRGPAHGNLVGWEVIDNLIPAIQEEMTIEGIVCEVIPTRKAPGATPEERLVKMEPGVMVVHLTVGEEPLQSTITQHKDCKELASRLHREVLTWGRNFNRLHADGGVKKTPLWAEAGSKEIVSISVFSLAAASAGEYAVRLPQLGQALGFCLARYAKELNPTLGFKPQQMIPRPWLEEKR